VNLGMKRDLGKKGSELLGRGETVKPCAVRALENTAPGLTGAGEVFWVVGNTEKGGKNNRRSKNRGSGFKGSDGDNRVNGGGDSGFEMGIRPKGTHGGEGKTSSGKWVPPGWEKLGGGVGGNQTWPRSYGLRRKKREINTKPTKKGAEQLSRYAGKSGQGFGLKSRGFKQTIPAERIWTTLWAKKGKAATETRRRRRSGRTRGG